MTFKELNFRPELLEAIDYMGFDTATPIQEKAIPVILSGKDLVACAQTGTGKTAAFILPILNKLIANPSTKVNTLVICPTRELAIQIDQQIQGFSYFIDVRSIAIYGGGSGSDFEQQKSALSEGANIIVATPGKLISHLSMGYVDFSEIQHLVLDEADRMLDMGFIPDIERIISFLPQKKQALFFSATMPPKIRKFCQKMLHDPIEISLAVSKPAEGVVQKAFILEEKFKANFISKFLDGKKELESIIIFSSMKSKVNEIVRQLKSRGHVAYGVSSDLDQSEREEIVMKFKAKRVRILVATDVLSRGIDIKDIQMVINYDMPNDAQEYVHRVGRTARANTTGEAVTLLTAKDIDKFAKFESLLGISIEQIKVNPN